MNLILLLTPPGVRPSTGPRELQETHLNETAVVSSFDAFSRTSATILLPASTLLTSTPDFTSQASYQATLGYFVATFDPEATLDTAPTACPAQYVAALELEAWRRQFVNTKNRTLAAEVLALNRRRGEVNDARRPTAARLASDNATDSFLDPQEPLIPIYRSRQGPKLSDDEFRELAFRTMRVPPNFPMQVDYSSKHNQATYQAKIELPEFGESEQNICTSSALKCAYLQGKI